MVSLCKAKKHTLLIPSLFFSLIVFHFSVFILCKNKGRYSGAYHGSGNREGEMMHWSILILHKFSQSISLPEL